MVDVRGGWCRAVAEQLDLTTLPHARSRVGTMAPGVLWRGLVLCRLHQTTLTQQAPASAEDAVETTTWRRFYGHLNGQYNWNLPERARVTHTPRAHLRRV